MSVGKKCSKCGAPGPFWKHKNKPDGLCNYCVPCMKQMNQKWRASNQDKAKLATRKWKEANAERVLQNKLHWASMNPDRVKASRMKSRLKKYGLDVGHWQLLFDQQRGQCALCRLPMEAAGRGAGSAAVDHDHATGKVRGLLHNSCNQAIGLMREDPKLLRLAAKYLEKNNAL